MLGVMTVLIKVAIAVQYGLLRDGIRYALKDCENFICYPVINCDPVDVCITNSVDILVSEVSFFEGEDFKTRMDEVIKLRKVLPGCKSVFLVDKNSFRDLAGKVEFAKESESIDGFLYTSVETNQFIDYLNSICC